MSDGPSRRRPRVDDSVVNINGEVNRDEVIWFDDGNIILIAGDTSFRVYKGLLAQRSEIFSDLFTVPQPLDAEEIDDCPVVRLSDSPQDLKYFLQIIFNHSTFFQLGKRIDFAAVSAIIRLGHKYSIACIIEKGISLLKTSFPDHFDDWNESSMSDSLRCSHIDAMEVVNIARLTGTDSLLPTALYRCCQSDEELFTGTHRQDGTVVQLTDEDLRRCLRGKVSLMREATSLWLSVISPDTSSQCRDEVVCRTWFIDTMRDTAISPRLAANVDPLAIQDGHFEFDEHEPHSSYCPSCILMLKARILRERRRVWRGLPKYMDVTVLGWGSEIPFDARIDMEPL